MQNFTFNIPTVVHFGKGQISKLGEEIASRASRVLVVYGGGSVKRNGVYDGAVEQMKAHGIEWVELSGVEPNPRIITVRKGVELCRANKLDGVLALGGGSVIDCSKSIAAGACYDGDVWDFPSGKAVPEKALPIFTVLTMAATGSEMDTSAVISNMETHEKVGVSAPGMRPVVSIMDPEYSFTVSKFQTAAGTADIMSHVMEVYFNNHPDAYLQNRFAEAVLKTCVKYGHRAWQQPDDYEARANLMWASSWAINGLLTKGAPVGWSVHLMEHELSAYYDVTHGAGLAVLIPHWLRHMLKEENVYKYVDYGTAVWGIDASLPPMEIAGKAIEATADYFKAMGLPTTLRELGIGEEYFGIMAKKAGAQLKSAFVPMDEKDVLENLPQSVLRSG